MFLDDVLQVSQPHGSTLPPQYLSAAEKHECRYRLDAVGIGEFGIHKVSAGVSSEYRKLKKTAFWVYAKGIPTNDFHYDNLGATAARPYGGTESTYEDQSLASVMGNITYNLLGRYSVAVNARGDGSSMVGDNNTWGFFGSPEKTCV